MSLSRRLNTVEKIEKFFTSELPKMAREPSKSPSTGFENSRIFLEKLGNPQDAHKVIHIAGTSGKGTVCYMIDAILRAHNKRTALLVSPHVYDIRERIQINGQFMPERHYISLVNEILEQLRQTSDEKKIGYYRLMSVIGFAAAARSRLDYVVAETSMGGRYDTTNAISRDDTLSVFTQLGIDHTSKLGTTYEQIAREKVAIVRPGSTAIALRQKQVVNEVFQNKFDKLQAKPTWVDWTENYQINNILIAYESAKQIAARDGWKFDDDKARYAAQSVYIPGRFEKRLLKDKLVILDGAHNPQKIRALSWRLNNEDYTPCTFVLALKKGQDIEAIIDSIAPLAKRLICTEFFTGKSPAPIKAIPCQKLAEVAKKKGVDRIDSVPSALDALRKAAEYQEVVVTTGSFYLLGEVDALF